MLGPIFHLEMTLGGRRRRQHVLRWVLGGWLLLSLVLYFYPRYWQDAHPTDFNPTTFVKVDLPTPPTATAVFAVTFTRWILLHDYLIIILATPVFTAGAITDEKTRGTLLYLFAADLTAWEILVGKLLGRANEVLLLLLITLPFLCFIGLFGGVTPLALLAIALSLLGPLFAVGSASLLMSVWCRQTRDAVVGLYAIGGLLALVWFVFTELGGFGAPGSALRSLQRLAEYFNPYHVSNPAMSAAPAKEVFACLIGSWAVWGVVGASCLSVALWRLRAAYMRQLQNSGKGAIMERLIPNRAAVSEEPLLWKERHVDGIAPLALFKAVPRWFALPAIVIGTVLVVAGLLALISNTPIGTVLVWLVTFDTTALTTRIKNHEAAFFLLGAVVLVLGSLVVGIRCSGTVCGEREKQTWEALLLTPLETGSLIRNKLWGILGAAVPYVLCYTLPALFLATLVGPPQGWFLTGGMLFFGVVLAVAFRKRLDSLTAFWVFYGLALITMVLAIPMGSTVLFATLLGLIVTTMAMFYMGAAGVWCSVKFQSSWVSLLVTLAIGYVGGLILWIVTIPLTAIIGLILYAFFEALSTADAYLGTHAAAALKSVTNTTVIGIIASCIVLAGAFLGVPWWFIRNAEYKVGFLERIRIWREGDEPGRIRRRGRMRRVKKAV